MLLLDNATSCVLSDKLHMGVLLLLLDNSLWHKLSDELHLFNECLEMLLFLSLLLVDMIWCELSDNFIKNGFAFFKDYAVGSKVSVRYIAAAMYKVTATMRSDIAAMWPIT